MDPELARLHREGACPFFAAGQKARALVDEKILKLEDGTQIPIDDVAEIFESFSLDDMANGEWLSILNRVYRISSRMTI